MWRRFFRVTLAVGWFVFLQTALFATAGDDVPEFSNEGMPFGVVTDADADQLVAFAKARNTDLPSLLRKAYANDEEGLAQLFQFATRFGTLDMNARTYGQLIYSSLLNMGESGGSAFYAKVLANQSPDAQQRIRDFNFYPVTKLPQPSRSVAELEIKRDHPQLIPKDYRFGSGNPLFEDGDVPKPTTADRQGIATGRRSRGLRDRLQRWRMR